MYSWVKHSASVSCYVNILIIVINGVRKYFDRQQSRWTFPSHGVFRRGIWTWRDYPYIGTEEADGVLASWSDINKAAVFFFAAHAFAIPAGPQQAGSCLPISPWLQRGARQEAVWTFTVRQPAAGLDRPLPCPCTKRAVGPQSCLSSAQPPGLQPGCWLLGCHPLPAPTGKETGFRICQHWHFEESTCFLGGILFLVRKLEALKMSAPNFSTLDPIGVSFSFPFVFLGTWESGEASVTFFCLPQALELPFNFFSAKSVFPPQEGNFFLTPWV